MATMGSRPIPKGLAACACNNIAIIGKISIDPAIQPCIYQLSGLPKKSGCLYPVDFTGGPARQGTPHIDVTSTHLQPGGKPLYKDSRNGRLKRGRSGSRLDSRVER